MKEKQRATDELTALQAELPELESQRNLAKRQLEEETLVRVDLENRLQSLKEELVFKKSLFDSELNETRKKKELEITEIGIAARPAISPRSYDDGPTQTRRSHSFKYHRSPFGRLRA